MPAVKAECIRSLAGSNLSNVEIANQVGATREYVSEVLRRDRKKGETRLAAHDRQTLVSRLLSMVERKDEEITSELKRMNGMLEAIVNELHSN